MCFLTKIFLSLYLPRLRLVAYLGRCVGNARFLSAIKRVLASVAVLWQPWVCPRSGRRCTSISIPYAGRGLYCTYTLTFWTLQF